jgi:hypothetical protein
MKSFLTKLEEKVTSMEKYFEEDLARNTSLNQFLYEYEKLSILAYTKKNLKEGEGGVLMESGDSVLENESFYGIPQDKLLF